MSTQAIDTSKSSAPSLITMILRNQIWVFLLLTILFFALASPYFMTVNNVSNVLTQSAFVGLLAIGMTMVILNGDIDLSVGATLGLCGALAIGLQPSIGVWPSIAVAILAGALLGMINGLIVVWSGMNAFIVTLGSLIGIRGLVFVYTGENALMVEDFSYTEIPEVYFGPISLTAVIFFGIALLFQWVLSSTKHGVSTFAVGDNAEAAFDVGIDVKSHRVINFTICGILAAIAGVLLSMRLGTAEPNAGKIWELWAIIAVVLGGTRLQGGMGSMWKTIGGVLTLAFLQNGLRLLNTPNFVELMVMGIVLVVALALDKLIHLGRQ